MKDFLLTNKLLDFSENPGSALKNFYLNLLKTRRRKKRSKKRRKKKNKRKNKKRKKRKRKRRLSNKRSLKKRKRRKKNKRKKRKKTKRKRKDQMMKKKKSIQFMHLKRRKIHLIYSLNLHSTLMTGRDNFAMPLIRLLASINFGKNSIMTDGQFGESTTSYMKEREKLTI